MKSCMDCKFADWKRNTLGRLHPDGKGRCTKKVKIPELPQAYFWAHKIPPSPNGGSINRHEELEDHCVYYTPLPKNT